MKIDIVVGNPPYNNDLYLDFVQNGYKIAGEYTLMITPAKWQAKGGAKNEAFRQNIVPHMSKIVYYPDVKEVFDISEPEGITYYILDKNKHNEKEIINICNKQKKFNNTQFRCVENTVNNTINDFIANKVDYTNNIKISTDRTFWVRANTKFDRNSNSDSVTVFGGDKFGDKLVYGYYNKSRITKNVDIIPKYKCVVHFKQGNGYSTLDDDGMTIGLKPINIYMPNEICKDDYMVIGVLESIIEAKNFKKYFDTRFVRFLIYAGCVGDNASNNETWRFVPDPGSFNKIFEDKPLPGYTPNEQGEYTDKDGNVHCSLYVKYGLTEDEINIIESVIKERK